MHFFLDFLPGKYFYRGTFLPEANFYFVIFFTRDTFLSREIFITLAAFLSCDLFKPRRIFYYFTRDTFSYRGVFLPGMRFCPGLSFTRDVFFHKIYIFSYWPPEVNGQQRKPEKYSRPLGK